MDEEKTESIFGRLLSEVGKTGRAFLALEATENAGRATTAPDSYTPAPPPPPNSFASLPTWGKKAVIFVGGLALAVGLFNAVKR